MRARALSQNWDYHTWLLERTLDSLLAQTNPDFNAVIVCHEIPDIAHTKHPKLEFLSVDFPEPNRKHAEMCRDKVLKISRGVEWAISRGSEHVMFVDADDLVSRRLSEFVAAHSRENGWYFQTGFTHCYGERWVYKHSRHHLLCGTCVIVRTDLLHFEKSGFHRGGNVTSLANVGHCTYVAHLAEQGAAIQPLPFAGAVYVLHPDSTAWVKGEEEQELPIQPLWRRPLTWGKQIAKTLPKIRLITRWMRAEFTIPHANASQRQIRLNELAR